MKRNPLRRNSILNRRTQLVTRSARRRSEEALWGRVKASAMMRDVWDCQARLVAPEPCYGRLEPHHVWPVGRGGPRLDVDNVITLCHACHRYIHEHPAWAEEVGLLRRS